MRFSLPRVTAVVAALGLVPVAGLDGFPWEIAAGLWGVVLWRLAAGGSARPLLRRRLRLPLDGLVALFALAVLHGLASTDPAGLLGLLVLLALVQTLCLVRPQTSFVTFLVLLLSTIHVTGAAFLHPDMVALAATGLYLVLLAWAFVLFERRMAVGRAERTHGVVQRVRVGPTDTLPPTAVGRTVAGLCTVGFLTGLLLYVALPRGLFASDGDKEDPAPDRPAVTEGWSLGKASEIDAFTTGVGAQVKGIRLGDIGTIKRDLTPYFEVRLPDGITPWLRENTYDIYRRGDWSASEGESVPAPQSARARPHGSGWILLDREDDPYRGYDMRIRVYRGPQQRLYLQRDPVRIRILRGNHVLPTVLRRQDNEQIDSFLALRAGDVIEERLVPPVSDPSALEAAHSDASVAPRSSYVDLPPECRPLVALAQRVVGTETNAWKRAQALERWLLGNDFAYTLRMPEVDTERPVVDFLLRRRSGHCEYFAASLTLLLRALGYPSRIVRGFRGGDYLTNSGTWMLRGIHYHAWTEMYFEGLGWIALDATPPDRNAVDADESITRVADRPSRGRDTSFALRFLNYGDEDRRALAAAIGRFFERYIVGPFVVVFGPEGWFVGFPVLAIVLTLSWRRRRRVKVARTLGVERRAVPRGPYGRALEILASRGLCRRSPQTAREFQRDVVRLLPAAGPALGSLTRLYERDRFGGLAPGRDELEQARENVSAVGTVTEAWRKRHRTRS